MKGTFIILELGAAYTKDAYGSGSTGTCGPHLEIPVTHHSRQIVSLPL